MFKWLEESAFTFGALIASIVSIVGVVVALFSVDDTRLATNQLRQIELELALETRTGEILAQSKALVEAELNSLLNSIDLEDDAALGAKLQEVDRRLDEAFAQLSIVDTIATAIQESPERAMSIPILRRDVDALGVDVAEDVAAIRAEVDRIYDLGKWFLGLIATMAVGVLGLAIGNLRPGKE